MTKFVKNLPSSSYNSVFSLLLIGTENNQQIVSTNNNNGRVHTITTTGLVDMPPVNTSSTSGNAAVVQVNKNTLILFRVFLRCLSDVRVSFRVPPPRSRPR